MKEELKRGAKEFESILNKKGIMRVFTHFDCDGITSATIFTSLLTNLNQRFRLSVLKYLEPKVLEKIKEEIKKNNIKAVVFLDLASSYLEELAQMAEEHNLDIFVIDHHHVENLPQCKKLHVINSFLFNRQYLTSSCLVYLFSKELGLSEEYAQVALLGLLGDKEEKSVESDGKEIREIIEDAKRSGLEIKKGLTLFSATRPLHYALAFNSNLFIPGITGNREKAIEFLNQLGIKIKKGNDYRTLLDLDEREQSLLLSNIIIKRVLNGYDQNILSNIFLVNLNNRIWDARELATMINACGKLGYASIAIGFLIGSKKAKEKMEEIYIKYKQKLLKALNIIHLFKEKEGNNYVIFNVHSNIDDSIIGTVMSILASSGLYPSETVLVGVANSDNYLKVSARVIPPTSLDLYDILKKVGEKLNCEVGGHKLAAGCLIKPELEKEFIELLEKELSIEKVLA